MCNYAFIIDIHAFLMCNHTFIYYDSKIFMSNNVMTNFNKSKCSHIVDIFFFNWGKKPFLKDVLFDVGNLTMVVKLPLKAFSYLIFVADTADIVRGEFSCHVEKF